MAAIVRPEVGGEYFAPISLASSQPLVFGEARGFVVDTPSQSAAVLYTTREAAEQAIADPEQWAAGNLRWARLAHIRYLGHRVNGAQFEFVTEEEQAAHRRAMRGEA